MDAVTDRAMNKTVLDSLPTGPRDSYWFWARLCRQYTGAHFLDSGLHGRMHSQPIEDEKDDPITIYFHDGAVDYASISTSHWLHRILDASNPVAEAIERRLRQLGEEYPDEQWDATIDRLREPLWAASDGFLTYNHENDFNQDFQVDLILEDRYGDRYAVLRTHNGADIRSGYSDPVVAKILDRDYLYSWQVDAWCQKCHESRESLHEFGKSSLDEKDLKAWYERLGQLERVENGQTAFLDIKWDFDMPIETATLLVEAWQKGDFEMPVALVDGHLLKEDGAYPASDVALLCPKCRRYGVRLGNTVAYGF